MRRPARVTHHASRTVVEERASPSPLCGGGWRLGVSEGRERGATIRKRRSPLPTRCAGHPPPQRGEGTRAPRHSSSAARRVSQRRDRSRSVSAQVGPCVGTGRRVRSRGRALRHRRRPRRRVPARAVAGRAHRSPDRRLRRPVGARRTRSRRGRTPRARPAGDPDAGSRAAERRPGAAADRHPPRMRTSPTRPRTRRTSERQQAEPPSLDDVVLAAALAAIPPGLLAALAAGQAPATRRQGRKGGSRRVREPSGSADRRARRRSARGRLALLATLRAAAPWQGLRRAEAGAGDARTLIVRPEDFRIDALSPARPRARRSSRSTPPARRRSNGSPRRRGRSSCCWPRPMSGATGWRSSPSAGRRPSWCCRRPARWCGPSAAWPACPAAAARRLAAGLDAAADIALAVRRGGGTPVVVLLTDGRANIDRAGAPGRAARRRGCARGRPAVPCGRVARHPDRHCPAPAGLGRAPSPMRWAPAICALPQADARKLSAAVRAVGEAA